MVKAGGKGIGTTSNKKDPIKTNRYCRHIVLMFYNLIIKEKNSKYFFNNNFFSVKLIFMILLFFSGFIIFSLL